MSNFNYPVLISEEAPGEFLATFRDIPEAITGGATAKETFILAVDALSVAIEGLLEDGRTVAAPSQPQAGEIPVPLDPAIAGRLALSDLMRSQHVSGRALAERLGRDEKHVRRILQGKASLDATLDALRELGVRPALSIEEPRVAA